MHHLSKLISAMSIAGVLIGCSSTGSIFVGGQRQLRIDLSCRGY